MKVIKPGVIVKQKPWWVGMIVVCPICTGEYELVEGDEEDFVPINHPRKAQAVSVRCLTADCKITITLESPKYVTEQLLTSYNHVGRR